MADLRQVDCFGKSCDSPRNDEVEPLESSLRDSTHSVESWQSTQDLQAKFHANEADLSNICAEILARIAMNRHAIFLLNGDIGAGKTTLVKAFAKQVGISDSVTSPTFSLLHIYGSLNSSLGMQFRTCENFCETTDNQSSFIHKNSHKYKSHTTNTRICEKNAESTLDSAPSKQKANSSIFDEKSGLCSHERGNRTDGFIDEASGKLPDLSQKDAEFAPKIYHYDLFNRNLGELLDLGLLDLLEESGIHFVEWGDLQLFDIIKNAFENIFIINIHKTKNARIYEFKENF